MNMYVILSNKLMINFISFNIAVLIGAKGDVNYFCDDTDKALL